MGRGCAISEDGQGEGRATERFGVIDRDVKLSKSGATIHNPMRVMPSWRGQRVRVFTL